MRGMMMVVALAAGCGGSPDEALDALPTEAAPPPATFTLSASNFVAGSPMTLTAQGLTPGTQVRFAYSAGGLASGPCPAQLGGPCLDIRGPVTLLPVAANVNGAGVAALSLVVPSNAAGTHIAFQAAVLGAPGRVSNPISRLIATAGTVINPTADSDGDGFTVQAGDCADFDARVSPGANDTVGDRRDRNCDNADGIDDDGDGTSSAASGGTDCDDADAAVNVYAVDVCNGIDDNCDALIDVSGGVDACGVTEVFNAGSAQADVLFVIDNSCSMTEEQGALSAAAADFATPLSGAARDLHLGVVTTDMDSANEAGRLALVNGLRFASSLSMGAGTTGWLQSAFNRGTMGSANERGLDAAEAAVTNPLESTVNAGFLRPAASLHVVFLSDEPDFSAQSGGALTSTMTALKGGLPFVGHAIVGPVNGCATADQGLDYLDVAAQTGGITASICGASYSAAMGAIADAILAEGGQTYRLAQPADPTTIEVVVQAGGSTIIVDPSQWTYDPVSQQLTIDGLTLTPGSVVTVTYDI